VFVTGGGRTAKRNEAGRGCLKNSPGHLSRFGSGELDDLVSTPIENGLQHV